MDKQKKNWFLKTICGASKAVLICFVAYLIVCLVNNSEGNKK